MWTYCVFHTPTQKYHVDLINEKTPKKKRSELAGAKELSRYAAKQLIGVKAETAGRTTQMQGLFYRPEQ